MKALIYLFVLSLLVFLTACEKGTVPDTNQRYIGTWRNTVTSGDSYIITIKDDGTAEYHEASKSRNKDVTGYVFFNGPDFKIGTKNFGSVKFKTNKLPERVTVTLTPYVYYYIAAFNNIDFKKDSL